jgi:hypothetical protein
LSLETSLRRLAAFNLNPEVAELMPTKREYDDVKDAIERNLKENWLFNGDPFSQHRGNFPQLHVTIEIEGVFTTPWTATLTYYRGPTNGRKS